jgi:glycosyltransferase involved in cell wall biosynthesis
LKDSIINNETGLLVRPSDPEALAEAITQILTDDALRAKLSEKALIYSRSFSWDKVANEFMKVVKAA